MAFLGSPLDPAGARSDPVAFGGAAALLITVVIVASLISAVRASRIHPAEALRHE